MSVQTEITRLQGLKTRQRTKLVGLGLAQSSDNLEQLTEAVEGIADNGAVNGTISEKAGAYTVPKGYHNGGVLGAGIDDRCLQNRFPAGIGGEAEFSSIGKTGGEKTHALTTSEAPPIDSGNYLITGGTRERWIDGYNGSAGQPHNNLPPYEVVSFWRRTA